ncbi:hypothetical protein EW146_g3056 [Bondarzewia mesenterica]|uniref:Uncharacterized protein n=1 Tax=Bondarzewia mesenterica TaxID=1095465 RepID=A0A4S4M121_9AGAM|nr:hypothetical protein EW146_g3056 [Bondarzewia mesenterica]
MGTSQSNLTSEGLLTAVVVAGALAFGYVHYTQPAQPQQPSSSASTVSRNKKGNKKKKQLSAHSDDVSSPEEALPRAQPIVVPFPSVIPGAFESGSIADVEPSSKSKKAKKRKKAKKDVPSAGNSGPAGQTSASAADAMSESSEDTPPAPPPGPSSAKPKSKTARLQARHAAPEAVVLPEEEHWTRVESRRKKTERPTAAGPTASTGSEKAAVAPLDVGQSDAGITTSVTGNSSPVAQRTTEDELPKSGAEGTSNISELPQIVGVKPKPGEQPAQGFTWEDYEGVHVDNDASGEDEGGWGVVRGKGRSRGDRSATSSSQAHSSKSTESMTKKQRQNAAKREAQKAAKQDAEAERLAVLSQHKRELENTKMTEQFASKGKRR